jgi:hypothetical protein
VNEKAPLRRGFLYCWKSEIGLLAGYYADAHAVELGAGAGGFGGARMALDE